MARISRRSKPEIAEISQESFGTMIIDGTPYKTILTDKFLHRKKFTGNNDNVVTSKIPGTIKKINVNVGDFINKGDILCILDSMKMNNDILSTHNGTITNIFIKVGEVINKDELLFSMDIDEPIIEDVFDDSVFDDEESLEDNEIEDDNVVVKDEGDDNQQDNSQLNTIANIDTIVEVDKNTQLNYDCQ